MDLGVVCRRLYDRGVIRTPQPTTAPLAGGVSCDVYEVDDGERPLVVKWALPRLRVRDTWEADPARNATEADYLTYVGRLLRAEGKPDLGGAVPGVVYRDAESGFFAMQHMGAGFEPWKARLLRGDTRGPLPGELPGAGRLPGAVLGVIHRRAWGDPEAAGLFATDGVFDQLRLDAYLRATGRRHRDLKPALFAEADRLAGTHLTLVHGDYSPKNLLVSDDRLAVVDCETAWFGDPAFDTAFLLNHLLLKAIYHAQQQSDPAVARAMLGLAGQVMDAYRQALGDAERAAGVDRRTARLLPMLLLARVDGKSPAEYLTDPRAHETIRRFARRVVPDPMDTTAGVVQAWGRELGV